MGAWAVPVLTLSVSAPLASASPKKAQFSVLAGGTIVADDFANGSTPTGSSSGTLEAQLIVSNVVGSWETGIINANYILADDWITHSIRRPDGTAFVNNSVITHMGVAWTVTTTGLGAIVPGQKRRIRFRAASQVVSAPGPVTFYPPPAIFSGTYDPDVFAGIRAEVAAQAANLANNALVTNSVSYVPQFTEE